MDDRPLALKAFLDDDELSPATIPRVGADELAWMDRNIEVSPVADATRLAWLAGQVREDPAAVKIAAAAINRPELAVRLSGLDAAFELADQEPETLQGELARHQAGGLLRLQRLNLDDADVQRMADAMVTELGLRDLGIDLDLVSRDSQLWLPGRTRLRGSNRLLVVALNDLAGASVAAAAASAGSLPGLGSVGVALAVGARAFLARRGRRRDDRAQPGDIVVFDAQPADRVAFELFELRVREVEAIRSSDEMQDLLERP